MTRQSMTYSYVEGGNRYSVRASEAKFGWTVTVKKNGVVERTSTEIGGLLTVMREATGNRF